MELRISTLNLMFFDVKIQYLAMYTVCLLIPYVLGTQIVVEVVVARSLRYYSHPLHVARRELPQHRSRHG
jgi:hypothetical protein